MVKEQIDKLLAEGEFPEPSGKPALVETHISWVILCDRFVYKIKKPIHYSFLDFSTLELRRHFCLREIELNNRFSSGIYLDIMPIFELAGRYCIGRQEGTLIDFAVKMRKLDPELQMDVLLSKNKVSRSDIKCLAECIADFHKNTTIIYQRDVLDVKYKFNDLDLEIEFLSMKLDPGYGRRIGRAIEISSKFMNYHEKLLQKRLRFGLFRDCHGDLHTRNIFLLPAPQPFDCIEFNDDFRQIDVLNEVAFLCMDLDASGRQDLSDLLADSYNLHFTVMRTTEEHQLFTYYKSYRANVRAKVNSLRARSASDDETEIKALEETRKYLGLMEAYLQSLDIP